MGIKDFLRYPAGEMETLGVREENRAAKEAFVYGAFAYALSQVIEHSLKEFKNGDTLGDIASLLSESTVTRMTFGKELFFILTWRGNLSVMQPLSQVNETFNIKN